jgi:hypothetical protein
VIESLSTVKGMSASPIEGPRSHPNVVILTSGVSGSSVLTGLISRAGYWTGTCTHKKEKEYDTFENRDLIQLNLDLFRAADFAGNYAMEFCGDGISSIAALRGHVDEGPFKSFVETCQQHRPWIWKDPRLWLTIRFWKDLLPLSDCRFIVLTRDLRHNWLSSIQRRHIRSFGSMKRYELAIKSSIVEFLDGNRIGYLHMTYENLIVKPEQEIWRLNAYLGTNLEVADLAAIYHNRLYKVPRGSVIDHVKAWLIYIKNYSQRFDLAEKAKQK